MLRAKLARGSTGLGAGPDKRAFQISAKSGIWKIRKCIDTCIACSLAPLSKSTVYLDTFHKVME